MKQQFRAVIVNIKLMTDQQIERSLQLPSANAVYNDVCWIARRVDYRKMQLKQLHTQNIKILNTLKILQAKLSTQLQVKKKLSTKKYPQNQNIKAYDEKIKNNEKLIASLKKDFEAADQRKSIINQGLQSKTIQNKFTLQRQINQLKTQIKNLRLQEHQTTKRLQSIRDLPQNYQQHTRTEQQLRFLSIKYVRLLDKYNKSTQKLALASNTEIPQFQIPQDIYDKQLQQRQQAQYKQYQGIVKLCSVLSHRNDSEHNKAYRQYTQKLKQLESTIMKLGQLDQTIATRQGELIQSKKNVELAMVRASQYQEAQNQDLRLSQGSIPSIVREKSYSTKKLQSLSKNQKYKTIDNPNKIEPKLRNRGFSLSKIKMN